MQNNLICHSNIVEKCSSEKRIIPNLYAIILFFSLYSNRNWSPRLLLSHRRIFLISLFLFLFFTEITHRFQTARSEVRALLLQCLLPWLENVELVASSVPPATPLSYIMVRPVKCLLLVVRRAVKNEIPFLLLFFQHETAITACIANISTNFYSHCWSCLTVTTDCRREIVFFLNSESELKQHHDR